MHCCLLQTQTRARIPPEVRIFIYPVSVVATCALGPEYFSFPCKSNNSMMQTSPFPIRSVGLLGVVERDDIAVSSLRPVDLSKIAKDIKIPILVPDLKLAHNQVGGTA